MMKIRVDSQSGPVEQQNLKYPKIQITLSLTMTRALIYQTGIFKKQRKITKITTVTTILPPTSHPMSGKTSNKTSAVLTTPTTTTKARYK